MSTSTLSPEQLEALLDGPALAPPPGVIPRIENPRSLIATGWGVSVACIVVATAAILLRVFTKTRIIRQVNLADYTIILGWASFMGYMVPVCLVQKLVPGVHQWDITLRTLEKLLKYFHVGACMYGTCIFFVKLSILLQYVQIFAPIKKTDLMYWAPHFLIWINLLFYIATLLAEIWACSPMTKAWDPLITGGHCVNMPLVNIVASSFNAASDISILALPQVVIWRLNMSRRRKISTSAVFLIGVFACIAGIIRLFYTTRLYGSSDFSHYSWFAGVWTLPEIALGIVASCLTVFPKFFQAVRDSRLMSKISKSMQTLMSRTQSSPMANAEGHSKSDQPTTTKSPRRWLRKYQTLDDEQLLFSQSGTETGNGSVVGRPDEVYVMRSIDVDASSRKPSSA